MAFTLHLIFLTVVTFSASVNETNISTASLGELLTTNETFSSSATTAFPEETEEKEHLTSSQSIPTELTKTAHGNYSIGEVLNNEERPSWFKAAIKDLAYYLRAHKFNEFDRRYNRNGSGVERTNFKFFPKPPLRALHWEVHKYCESSFLLCVDYLRKKLKQIALKRQDDTSIVAQENNWGLNDSKKTSQVDMECRRMRNVDYLVAPPFEGPLERYQWRTTASYFMCWYTMNEVPDLKHLEENCDNFANCLDMSFGPNNNDPRANDSKPFACSQYSFCPDPCCANKHLSQMDFCWNDEENPCFHENSVGQRECFFNRTHNTDLSHLILNRWNITCHCPKAGYTRTWSSLYGICVDVDECVEREHGCTSEGQACVNLPESFTCVCRWGYIYSEKDKKCIISEAVSEMKLNSQEKNKNETRSKWKIFIKTVVSVLGRSRANKFGISSNSLLLTIFFFVHKM